ncbi:MAG TPA: M20 family metallopeptidase [Alphaproteobacteria bacterium]|nr:M20 family metallopeptidase [Alphaproteobacteria bacterium]
MRAALDLIERDEALMLDQFDRLLGLDTSFPPGAGYAELADAVEPMTVPLGFTSKRVVVPQDLWDSGAGDVHGDRVNVVSRRDTGLPVCSIYFHVDTVPPGPGWTKPPFRLTREGQLLYGRGAADMKGTIVAVLAAIRAMHSAGVAFAFDPALLFCTDEEGGLYPGIRYLAEQGLVEGHLLSFNGQAMPRIWAGCFGSIDLRIDVEGRSTHSGDPGNGVNAVETAMPLLNTLMALKGEVETRRSAMPPPPHYPGGEPLPAKLTIAAIHGGHKGSALPGECTILVNRRYAPEEAAAAVLAELEGTVDRALDGSGAVSWRRRVVGHLAPVADPTGPHWPRWQAALSAGFGFADTDFRKYGSSTSSDMGWVQQAGIQEILLGGLVRPTSNAHGPDEHTTLADLRALARSVALYLARPFAPALLPA